MEDDPEGKEHFAKEWSPSFVPFVEGIGESGNDTNHVDDEECCWRDQKCSPFHNVELTKICIISCFGSDSKVGVNARKHLKETLEDGKEMR